MQRYLTLNFRCVRAALLVAGLAMAVSGRVQALDNGLTGIWHNPAQSGQGFEISVIAPTTAVVAWYTYSPFATPIWIVGVLQERTPGTLEGTMSYYDSMRFGSFNPAERREYTWGSLSIRFSGSDCNRANVSYNGALTFQTGEGFGSGTLPIEKLVTPVSVACGTGGGGPTPGAAPLAGIYRGLVTSAVNGNLPQDTFASISANGTFTAVIPDLALYTGTLTGNSTISADFRGIPAIGTSFPGGGLPSFTAIGNGRPMDYFDGTFSGSGDSGTLSFGWIGASLRSYSVAALAGEYADASGGSGFAGQLNAAGVLSGRDRAGCNYSGTLPTTAGNPITVTFRLSDCATSGSYSGQFWVADFDRFGDGKLVVLGLNSGTAAMAMLWRRP